MIHYATIRTEETMSAAHIVHTDPNSPCFRIHGHNWKAIIEVTGKVHDDGMIIDFKEIKSLLRQYDHKMWLPSPEQPTDCQKLIEMRRLLIQFAPDDIELINVPAVTCEHMAKFFAHKILHMTTFISSVR